MPTTETQTQPSPGEANPNQMMQDLLGGAVRFGQAAMVRHLDAVSAVSRARTPQDVIQAQIAYGQEAAQAYMTELARTSRLMTELFSEAGRAAQQRAAQVMDGAGMRPPGGV
jgi:hypothetical protein